MDTPNSGAPGQTEGTVTTQSSQLIETSPSNPPSTAVPSEEPEHAYWAEYEEDTTSPDEDEMKEIDGGDSDYSASDRMFHRFPFIIQVLEADWRLQTSTGKPISSVNWEIPSTCPLKKPASHGP